MTKVEQFEAIRRDRRLEGLSVRALARKHRVHRRQVKQALASAIPPERKMPERVAPVFGPYEEIVRDWLIADKKVPKKQRHTARRVHKRLVAEESAKLAESTVRRNVARIRREIGDAPEAMIPQNHDVHDGESLHEAEVDFGEFYCWLAGIWTKLWLFSLRLCASGATFRHAYATQAQEAFLHGHVDAFSRMHAVPHRIRYDNLKPAVARVLMGRDRVESERFVAFRSHYGFDSFYCRPGRQGAHEKGGVEGDIGYTRRSHLVPPPKVPSICEMNLYLANCDEADRHRVIDGKTSTIAADFAVEVGHLQALASEHFDTSRSLKPRVDSKSRVCVRQCFYSVPVSLISRRLSVALGAEEVVISNRSSVVARHERLVHRGDCSLRLDHYLEALVKKPGALPASVPLAQARASGAFSATHDAYWRQARRLLGDKDGTHALIDVLLAERGLGREAVIAGMAKALEIGVVSPEVVVVEARRSQGEHLADVIDIGTYICKERPAPSLADYDGLLSADGEDAQ